MGAFVSGEQSPHASTCDERGHEIWQKMSKDTQRGLEVEAAIEDQTSTSAGSTDSSGEDELSQTWGSSTSIASMERTPAARPRSEAGIPPTEMEGWWTGLMSSRKRQAANRQPPYLLARSTNYSVLPEPFAYLVHTFRWLLPSLMWVKLS
mmetsp:Transcript_27711/g.50561  ORF Transcript_27711/g.50561 Transcript_27711/m.50561 type:complete len:150 (+) Transcript_27711:35-484(+)